jgi:hypothetical protein
MKGIKMIKLQMAVFLVCSSLLGHALPDQEKKLPEPETLGVLYYFDQTSESLTLLERQIAKVKAGFTSLSAEIAGGQSPVRVRNGPRPGFVIRLASGVDPNKFQLYRFEGKKDKRKLKIAGLSGTTGAGIPCDVVSFGQSSYLIKPSKDLEPGEYGFSANDSEVVFAFGLETRDVSKN